MISYYSDSKPDDREKVSDDIDGSLGQVDLDNNIYFPCEDIEIGGSMMGLLSTGKRCCLGYDSLGDSGRLGSTVSFVGSDSNDGSDNSIHYYRSGLLCGPLLFVNPVPCDDRSFQ